jgi:hypothetical protein
MINRSGVVEKSLGLDVFITQIKDEMGKLRW